MKKCSRILFSKYKLNSILYNGIVSAATFVLFHFSQLVPSAKLKPAALVRDFKPLATNTDNGYTPQPMIANGYAPKSEHFNGNNYKSNSVSGNAPQKRGNPTNQNNQKNRSRSAQRVQRSTYSNNNKNNFQQNNGPPAMIIPNGGNTSSNSNGVNPGYVNPFKKTDVSVIIPSQPDRRSYSKTSDEGSRTKPEEFKNWIEQKPVQPISSAKPPTQTIHAIPPSPYCAVNTPQPINTTSSPLKVTPAFNAGPSRIVSAPLPAIATSSTAKSVSVPAPSITNAVVSSTKAPVAASKVLPFCEFPPSNSAVMITDVIGEKLVFVRSVSDAVNAEYFDTIQSVALYGVTRAKKLEHPPIVGQMILAPNSDHQLRRALVLKTVNPTTLLVAFIDFGSVSTALLTACRDLTDELQKRRRLVHRCSIDATTSERLTTLKASPLIITYDEPFTSSSVVKLNLA